MSICSILARRPARFGRSNRKLVLLVVATVATTVTPTPAFSQEVQGPSEFEVEQYVLRNGVSESVARERLLDQSRLPNLLDEAEEVLDGAYGGVYVDNDAGDQIALAVVADEKTDDVSRGNLSRADEAIDAAGLAGEVRVDATPRSEDKMEDLLANVRAKLRAVNPVWDEKDPDAELPPIIDAGIDIASSRILLSVPSGLSEEQRKTLNELIAGYGKRLATESKGTLQRLGCVQQAYCSPPMRGGTRFSYAGAEYCSWGLKVKNQYGTPGFTTAGHCIWEGLFAYGNGYTWGTRSDNQIPYVVGNTAFYANDIAVVVVANPGVIDPKHWLRNAQQNDYDLTTVENPVEGQFICATGSYSASNCGNVTGPRQQRDGIQHTYRANYCAVPGDSGGAVYASHKARGSIIGRYSVCDNVFFAVEQIGNLLPGWQAVSN